MQYASIAGRMAWQKGYLIVFEEGFKQHLRATASMAA